MKKVNTETLVAMEATGAYFQQFAAACYEHGCVVYVVNPWQVKAFADAGLSRLKTDKVDAQLIAEFCAVMRAKLWPWVPPPDSLIAVTALVRLGDSLMRQGVASGNRGHALRALGLIVEAEAVAVEQRLRGERDRLFVTAVDIAENCSVIGPGYEALQGLPGLGQTAALKVLAYSGDMRRFKNGRQYASYTGLTPSISESGDGERRSRMSRRGSGPLRSTFYWAAMSASQSKSSLGAFYRKLRENGKPPKVALIALANRLARASWAVVNRARVDEP